GIVVSRVLSGGKFMNRGVMRKAFHETWVNTLIIGAALLGFEILLARVLPILESQLQGIVAQLPFVQTMLKALLGADLGPSIGREAIAALAWVEPAVLALAWAHPIIICSRVPAGEVDRGTADVLFGLPLSRWNIYCSETVMWLMELAIVMLFGF